MKGRQVRCALGAALCLGMGVSLNLAPSDGPSVRSPVPQHQARHAEPVLMMDGFNWHEVFQIKHYLERYPAPLSEQEAETIAYAVYLASLKYNLSPEMILAVIATESSFNAQAVSPKGAVGLMQIMPSTGQYLAAGLGFGLESDTERLTDPWLNIDCGAYYLRDLMRRFGSVETALVAYNYGPTEIAYRIESGDFSPRAYSYPKKVLRENWPGALAPLR
ncbi:MAG: lytic transglycosylase domain-containing protein [Acidobacteriota bacterium]|nr:MAG: lytic transglycosylase domain-containing protein [Acidobacteriota bacterium]